jgi:chromosomal replication initiation ATPase DnaA
MSPYYCRKQVQSTSPYKGYAVYLARKHTPFSNPEIGRYFGGISYSAVTKIGTRIKDRMKKDRMKKDRKLSKEITALQKGLSRVKG